MPSDQPPVTADQAAQNAAGQKNVGVMRPVQAPVKKPEYQPDYNPDGVPDSTPAASPDPGKQISPPAGTGQPN
jgi:hypothetical protein